MTSLKIGLVLDDSLDKTDGVQQYVLAIGGWLSSQGHEVQYLVGETTRTDIPGIRSLSRNIKVRFNRNHMSMPSPVQQSVLRAICASEQFDVLHVQMPYSPWLAGRLIRAASDQTAVVGTFHIVPHSWSVTFFNRLLASWTRRSLQRFDTVLSVSSAAQVFAQRTFGLTSQILPNVVDYQRFSTAQPLPEYDDTVLTILFLGRLVARKGCRQLLEAVTRLVHESDDQPLPRFRVLICGKGPLEATLRQYSQQAGLDAYVRFVGYVAEENKPAYYASADIAVFPSTGGESFGIVLLEAMAAGSAAVLAGDNSGYRSVMAPRPDLLFKPDHTADLAQKLRHLLTDIAVRRTAAAWGSQYVKTFDTVVVGRQLLKHYQKALRKRRSL